MEFVETLRKIGDPHPRSIAIETLQVNLGYRCNLSCRHCHVQAGPDRPEEMSAETVGMVLRVLRDSGIGVLDITGGAPELNPSFRGLVQGARDSDRHVMARTNLTVFFEEGMEDLPRFFRDHAVELVASLPYYLEEGVDRVRGKGVFTRSIEALKRLNALGYGTGGDLRINLVYNPQGIYLPPSQSGLEQEYRRVLGDRFGIAFDRLFTLVNMPVGRFRDYLTRTNNLARYMEKLRCSFNAATLEGIMCRHLISVGWDGTLYDCDFNQVLGVPVLRHYPRSVKDFDPAALSQREIAFGDHCYGCTAGQGST